MSSDSANERQVNDPITHLPITIHDSTAKELENIPPPPVTSRKQPEDERQREEDSRQRHAAMESRVNEETDGRWADPRSAQSKQKVRSVMLIAATGAIGVLGGFLLAISLTGGHIRIIVASVGCLMLALGAGALVLFSPQPTSQDVPSTVGTESSEEANSCPEKSDEEEQPESAAWLNSFLKSLWPLVNPDLFTAISDMLEDTMQASLPKMVHGVRVADLGQGVESLRILGIRWLDAGDAAVQKRGMTAEEGDFVNLEVAVAYRARPARHGLKGRSQNAHLLIEFWTVADLHLPVWVELTGFLATARMRVHLSPNPPFLSVLTLSLLGQPKVTLACTPLAKSFVNVMDVPGLSGWLQKNIDAAVAAYVAPRSLTLDLKTMLTGKDKMDTDALGVLLVVVRRAVGFKDGDGQKVWASRDAKRGDIYVTVNWAKWGKPLWASRIIKREAEPIWEESTAVIVGPPDVNAQEKLKLQIWDSDRLTADDILGIVEISLKDLMTQSESKNQMSRREDDLKGPDGSSWPGSLRWDVGYFSKVSLEQHLLTRPDDVEEMKKKIDKAAEDKLREAKGRDESGEIDQQKKEDMKGATDEIIAGTEPNEEWPSGVLRVWIQQIHGLETEKIQESGVDEMEDDGSEDLPSPYCTIMLNQQRVYKSRTKIKSNKPYFDAGTERFVKDWRTTSVFIAVRDSRTHENDPLLGIVVLSLRDLFKGRSQISDSFPLVGGIGYGRVHLSVMFRSVQISLPRQLLGWDVGTLEISPEARASPHLPPELTTCRLVAQTLYGKGKLRPQSSGGWKQKQGRPIRLAVQKRYASCLLIMFRKNALGPDMTEAFSTLWLKDIPDDEEIVISLPVRRNTDGALRHARANATAEIGEHVGSLELKIRFWPGLSGYHRSFAENDPNMKDVVEVLDTAEDSREISQAQVDGGYGDTESIPSSELESSSGDEHEHKHGHGKKHMDDDGSRGLLDDVKEYRKHEKGLHRKHRGLMQWHRMRNFVWAKQAVQDKAHEMKDKMTGFSTHRTRGGGIDTEV